MPILSVRLDLWPFMAIGTFPVPMGGQSARARARNKGRSPRRKRGQVGEIISSEATVVSRGGFAAGNRAPIADPSRPFTPDFNCGVPYYYYI